MNLRDVAKRENSALVKGQARLKRQFEILLSNFSAQVQKLVTDPKNFPRDQVYDLTVASRVIDKLKDALNDAGADQVLDLYNDQFLTLVKEGKKFFVSDLEIADTVKFSSVSTASLDAYMQFSEDGLVAMMDQKLVGPMQTALFQATYGDLKRDDIIDTIATLTDNLSLNQVTTLVNDTFARFQRQVSITAGDELGLEIFWYQGPDDEITSPQCKDILEGGSHGVPGMYLRDEIHVGMVANLTEDPLIAGGHYNCRHKFFPIPESLAEAEGFDLSALKKAKPQAIGNDGSEN